VPRHFFYDDLNPEIESAVEKVLQMLRSKAQEVREIQLTPDIDRTVQAAEAYAFHSGSVAKTPELYQPETLRRIKAGEAVTREEYTRRLAELKSARTSIQEVFKNVDVIVTPTTPIPAPAIAELKKNPDLLRPRELLLLRNTRPFNVWGLPTISIPCGFTSDGLPIGLQVAGLAGRDDLVLQFAHACEKEISQSNLPRSKSS
jgi:Asp-tRNA(Asn)/Glu-tRNA(Gln) amidotransferase A subunit family amidase